ncbi:hypothetical protein SAMD00019534_025160 [Acytostelium subglobosum LB1]|uniref:hypothetical protein n=1 Tax=Acytostelium subglobosum LB1 TaxID=1410327 RepID=UPI00064509C4|nr:hypothetical protein SAMD00019534_025160 [Acytostelium subglobosum LB1]GAM19341.1 hypothetical protein SAMD00019534_025160 [Acytostelium subglobosum LB1]|eukprot:XP_012757268.1 hypothetical protein SAMD00019534_025160 [Acytostelium subglobosum LB1]
MEHPLILASQTYGSGSSALGQAFIHNLRKRPHITQTAARDLAADPEWKRRNCLDSAADCVDHLLELEPVYFDFRWFALNISKERRDQMDIKQWVKETIAQFLISISHIMGTANLYRVEMFDMFCQTPTLHRYFYHFDNLEYLFTSEFNINPERTFNCISHIWREVFQSLIKNGNPVYVSGTHAWMLHPMSQGRLVRNIFQSRIKSVVKWLIVSNQSTDDIDKQCRLAGLTVSEQVLQHFHRLTGGIPKLVDLAIKHIRLLQESASSPSSSDVDLDSKRFREYLIQLGLEDLFNPFSRYSNEVSDEMKANYHKLIRLSNERTVIDLTAKPTPDVNFEYAEISLSFQAS